jgi:phosphatidylglycerol lysyltransferase
MSDRRTLKRVLSGFFDLALFAVALITLSRILREHHWRDIEAALHQIATPQILLSLLITAAGYLSLVGYDYLSFGLIHKRLPLRDVLAPSFISYAVANSAPVSVVTGGGVRYRLYAGLGLTPGGWRAWRRLA